VLASVDVTRQSVRDDNGVTLSLRGVTRTAVCPLSKSKRAQSGRIGAGTPSGPKTAGEFGPDSDSSSSTTSLPASCPAAFRRSDGNVGYAVSPTEVDGSSSSDNSLHGQFQVDGRLG